MTTHPGRENRAIENVWDYPRPPRVEPSDELVRIVLGGEVIAETRASLRVLETSHPPTYYLPRDAFREGALSTASGASVCEWKGRAGYLTVAGGDRAEQGAAWHYPTPRPGFEALAGHVAVYPARMDRIEVDGNPALVNCDDSARALGQGCFDRLGGHIARCPVHIRENRPGAHVGRRVGGRLTTLFLIGGLVIGRFMFSRTLDLVGDNSLIFWFLNCLVRFSLFVEACIFSH